MDNNFYRLYIDESGICTTPRSLLDSDLNLRFLTLTGVVLSLTYEETIAFSLLDSFKHEYIPTHTIYTPEILHSTEIKGKRFPFDFLKDPEIHSLWDESLLLLIKNIDMTVISITVDKIDFRTRYPQWDCDVYLICLLNLLERYYMYLQARGVRGDVIIENTDGKHDRQVKQYFRDVYSGKHGRIHSFDKHFSSCEIKILTKQANSTGLQIADLVCGPLRQYTACKYGNFGDLNEMSTFTKRLINCVYPKIYCGTNRQINGCGLKMI